jgi:hypothetical protein
VGRSIAERVYQRMPPQTFNLSEAEEAAMQGAAGGADPETSTAAAAAAPALQPQFGSQLSKLAAQLAGGEEAAALQLPAVSSMEEALADTVDKLLTAAEEVLQVANEQVGGAAAVLVRGAGRVCVFSRGGMGGVSGGGGMGGVSRGGHGWGLWGGVGVLGCVRGPLSSSSPAPVARGNCSTEVLPHSHRAPT